MTLQKSIPFNIVSVFAQPWTAGQKGGGSGINVQMTIQNINQKEITLKDFYFRRKKTAIEDISTNNNGLHVARFINSEEKEVVMHHAHEKEAGNEPPKLYKKNPFMLEKNEGVISYTENGKLKYFKIENIIEKFPNYYPSAPQNKH